MTYKSMLVICFCIVLGSVGTLAQNTFPSTGNVGIGTATPGELLEIANFGNLRVTGDGFGINIDSNGSWSHNNWLYRTAWTGTQDIAYFAPSGNHSAAQDSAMLLTSAGYAQFGTGATSGQGLTTTYMTIGYNGGNVGVGTTTPGELFEIGNSGNMRVTGDLFGINVDSNGAWSYNNWLYRASYTSTYGDTVYFAPSGNHAPTQDAAMILSSNGSALFGTGTANGQSLSNTYMTIGANGGRVGIGTINPGYTLDVAGQVHASSGVVYPDGTQQTTAWTGVLCGGDYAEAVNVSGKKKSYEPGDVLVLDSNADGNVERSSDPYSTMVAGIYATKPGVIGRRQSLADSAGDIPMAMVGIVPTKVTAENGPIKQGNLLVTSSKPGYAMKGTDRSRMLGAVLGKAMGSLDSGTGVIEVLVTLQ